MSTFSIEDIFPGAWAAQGKLRAPDPWAGESGCRRQTVSPGLREQTAAPSTLVSVTAEGLLSSLAPRDRVQGEERQRDTCGDSAQGRVGVKGGRGVLVCPGNFR